MSNALDPYKCPDCRSHTCHTGCICPGCYLTPREDQAAALTAWKHLAAVLNYLNERDTYWSWSKDSHGYAVLMGDDSVQISPYRDGYLVTAYCTTRNATPWSPEEGEWVDVYCGGDAEDAVLTALAELAGE